MGIFDALLGKKKLTREQEIQIVNCRRIFTQSMEIMGKTESIDTFMSRYTTAAEALAEAGRVAGENTPCLGGVSPKEATDVLHRDIHAVLIPCIDRYMNNQTIKICGLSRGRTSKAQALEIIAETYQDRIPKECYDHFLWRISNLIRKLEKIDDKEKAAKLKS